MRYKFLKNTILLAFIFSASAGGLSEAKASFAEQQIKLNNLSPEELKKIQQENKRNRKEGMAHRTEFLRQLIRVALYANDKEIEDHILKIHADTDIDKISAQEFDGRKYYSVFHPEEIDSVLSFHLIVEETLKRSKNIFSSHSKENRRIKIVLKASHELGRIFTKTDYQHALNAARTNSPIDPMLMGKPGTKLVLILEVNMPREYYRKNAQNSIQKMENTNTFPDSMDGFTAEIVTAFLQ
tara:strand:+ start:5335 stop:6054 length:720 start_codon:yes stop_codon:yes gene_type:complete